MFPFPVPIYAYIPVAFCAPQRATPSPFLPSPFSPLPLPFHHSPNLTAPPAAIWPAVLLAKFQCCLYNANILHYYFVLSTSFG